MRGRRTVLVLMVLGVLGAAKRQSPGDGAIVGRVVEGVTGRPVSAAIVSIAGAGMTVNVGMQLPNQLRILTGADGRFLFRDLPSPGSFTITATKNGYADGASGRRRPGGTSQPIELSEPRRTADIVIRIWKNGAITGTVTDEAGEPIVGVQVRVLARTSVGGRRRLAPGGASVYTDDRGAYRVSNLTAGEYVVMASPPLMSVQLSMYADVARTGRASGAMPPLNGPGAPLAMLQTGGGVVLAIPRGAAIPPPTIGTRLQIYPTTFHPSALSPVQASAVMLASGDERTDVDIQLQPLPAARVSGTVVSQSGPLSPMLLRLLSAGSADMPGDVQGAGAFTDAAGAFAFAAVVPGQYTLQTTEGGGARELLWADLPITVTGEDIDNLVVLMNPALHVRGRLQFDGTPSKPEGLRGRFVPFALERADGGQVGAPSGRTTDISETGFSLSGYLPGRYLVRITNSPQGWMFKSAMLNGVDVSETPFELTSNTGEIVVTFTDRWSGISGVVQGSGSDAAAVIVFPTEAQRWDTPASSPRRLRLVRTNAEGGFGVSSLPPGDYFVAAIPDEDSSDWRDPAMLDALARVATQVTILEGEHKTLDLRLREVRR